MHKCKSAIFYPITLKICTNLVHTCIINLSKFQAKILKFDDTRASQRSLVSNFDFSCHLTLKICTDNCEKNRILKLCRVLENSCRKFLVPWKISLFEKIKVLWPTEWNMAIFMHNFNLKTKIWYGRSQLSAWLDRRLLIYICAKIFDENFRFFKKITFLWFSQIRPLKIKY